MVGVIQSGGAAEIAAKSPVPGWVLLLGAINRAIRPRSKRGWSAWAAETSLHRLFPGLKPDILTSQFFWDQMNCVSLEALAAIGVNLVSFANNHVYDQRRRGFVETLDHLEKYIPDIRDKVDHVEASTPRTFEHYTQQMMGSTLEVASI